jgi:hypothetical protein
MTEELEDLKAALLLLPSRKLKEEYLQEIRRLEASLGIESKNYNSEEF